jgi:hypothetical protein
MYTFFWGYFSKPWKRLLRTISVIIILFFSLVLYDSHYDSDRMICIVILISIPILSYVIEPFVLKNSLTNNKTKIENTKISELPDIKTKWFDIKLNKKITIPIWLSFKNEYIKGTTYLLRMIFGVLTIWILGLGLYFMVITTYKRSKSMGINKRNSIILCILIPVLIMVSSVIKITELSINSYIEDINRYYLFLGMIYLLLTPHFILWLKNGNKVLFETISTREKGKQFLNELEKKGPNTDNVGKIVVNINTTMDDYDEPLSEFRKLRNLKNEINREFTKND